MTFYSVILFVHVAGAERAAAALGEIAKRVCVRERRDQTVSCDRFTQFTPGTVGLPASLTVGS